MKYVHLDIENTGYSFLKETNIIKQLSDSTIFVYYNNITKETAKKLKDNSLKDILASKRISLVLKKTDRLIKTQVTDEFILDSVSKDIKKFKDNENIILTRDVDLINKFVEIFKGTNTPIYTINRRLYNYVQIIPYNPKDFSTRQVDVEIRFDNNTLYGRVILERDASVEYFVNFEELSYRNIPLELNTHSNREIIYKLPIKESEILRSEILKKINRVYVDKDCNLVFTQNIKIPMTYVRDNKYIVDSDFILANGRFLKSNGIVDNYKYNLLLLSNKVNCYNEFEDSLYYCQFEQTDGEKFNVSVKFYLTPSGCSKVSFLPRQDGTVGFNLENMEGWDIKFNNNKFEILPITEEARREALCELNKLIH